MFRGGPVDSRGTGITSGLDRPGLQGGGMPPTGGVVTGRALMNVPQPPKYSRPIGPPSGSLRGPIGKTFTRGRFKFPMLSSQARAAMGLGFPSLSTLGLMSLPFAPTAAMAAMNMPKTDEALKFMKETDTSVFDETAIPGMVDETGTYIPGEYEQFAEELSKKNREGKSISAIDVLAGYDPETDTYPRIFGRYEDIQKRADIEKNKSTDNPLEDTGDKSKLGPKDLKI